MLQLRSWLFFALALVWAVVMLPARLLSAPFRV